MRLLLDTHALLWALVEPSRISVTARRAIQDPDNEVRVSPASAWEIATKHRLGKLPSAALVVSAYAAHLRTLRASELPITTTHALQAGSFEQAHRDPFDRLLAAQALLEGIPLVTHDRAFDQFPNLSILW